MAENFSIVSANVARGAYGASKAMQGDNAPAVVDGQAAGKSSFAEMVEKAASDSVQTIREADAVAQAGLAGGATTQQVVEAAMAMESTVKIAVSVRDKFVAAYQEVLRMPI